MPPTTYTVGSGKTYSAIQTAINAVQADYPAGLTQNVDIVCTSGETFTYTSGLSVANFLLTVGTTFRLTLRGSDPTVKAIIDPGVTAYGAFYGSASNVTCTGFKVLASTVNGYQIYGFGNKCYFESIEFLVLNGARPTGMDGGNSYANRQRVSGCTFRPATGRMDIVFACAAAGFYEFYNNSVYKCEAFVRPYGADGGRIDSYNNAVYDNNGFMFAVQGGATTACIGTMDNNIAGSTSANWGSDNGTDYTLAAWRTHTGKDTNSVTGTNPKFVSTTDLHFQVSSPCRSGGQAIPAGSIDIDGTLFTTSCRGADQLGAATYLVGSGKPYSTIQSAYDAVISDFSGVLNADVTITYTSGETFSNGGAAAPVLNASSGLDVSTYRLTLASSVRGSLAIFDCQSVGGQKGVDLSGLNRVTLRGVKFIGVTGTTVYHQGSPKDCILEECDIGNVSGSRPIFGFNSSSSSNKNIVRNNYIHGTGTRGLRVEIYQNCLFYGNTLRFLTYGFELDGTQTEPLFIKNNVFEDISTNVYETNGSEAQLITNFSGKFENNIYNNCPTGGAFLSRYTGPQNYTLQQARDVLGLDINSQVGDPLLTSFANPTPGNASPARSRGIVFAERGSFDFSGNVRTGLTLGCVEKPEVRSLSISF